MKIKHDQEIEIDLDEWASDNSTDPSTNNFESYLLEYLEGGHLDHELMECFKLQKEMFALPDEDSDKFNEYSTKINKIMANGICKLLKTVFEDK